MKKLFFLFVVCVGCAAGAMAQVGGGGMTAPSEPTLSISGHPERASQTALAAPQDLIGNMGSVSARGERPLWEVMPESPAPTPLGDTARAVRKEHSAAKKAVVVWTN